jgi:hypothetical protein
MKKLLLAVLVVVFITPCNNAFAGIPDDLWGEWLFAGEIESDFYNPQINENEHLTGLTFGILRLSSPLDDDVVGFISFEEYPYFPTSPMRSWPSFAYFASGGHHPFVNNSCSYGNYTFVYIDGQNMRIEHQTEDGRTEAYRAFRRTEPGNTELTYISANYEDGTAIDDLSEIAPNKNFTLMFEYKNVDPQFLSVSMNEYLIFMPHDLEYDDTCVMIPDTDYPFSGLLKINYKLPPNQIGELKIQTQNIFKFEEYPSYNTTLNIASTNEPLPPVVDEPDDPDPDPDTPDAPTTPDEPTAPDDPSAPDEPATPDDPEDPAPTTPDDPAPNVPDNPLPDGSEESDAPSGGGGCNSGVLGIALVFALVRIVKRR